MYSILVSKITPGYELCHDFLTTKLNKESKIVILPWAFPTELNAISFEKEYFQEGKEKYNKYVNPLLKIGVKKENIFIANPYIIKKEELITKIKASNCLILPGGNPEMFFSKVIHSFDLLYTLKYYPGLIIGESAGACLHFHRYFITAKNNYYKYFAFYDGFGILNDDFYIDVHTSSNPKYIAKLKNISASTKKIVYALYNDGALIVNRHTKEVKILGKVSIYEP